MPFIARQERFTCEHCSADVEPLTSGSYRNHCPHCLYSKHVDKDGPGDRASQCGGLMRPTGMDYKSGKGWMIVHRCDRCTKVIPNITADDDNLAILSEKSIKGEV
ncbi:RNHCP domain-containing protein [Candidatus Peregrinibacteria bacterium CG10_big_fil_rev_8_21_14_0_10_49_24]|nr:MAG: RNHCP domain-containing protein [Candidatus Peregrinibacteria bacterium CG11_big_fil_rev_8_21_14_0_20_49_14]PIR50643.1 MAG: RNHCP domain-containing protein [Candidatus Peregrinibacteria bacterium CG10_big_fil_rev_8_21_14_0_10_49_24]PJA67727.1 MAG: RNHCP domain-containing protein [Candidatus Peregrinibacteria bacterium CG_4_9_14_3_um_filter_49_12]